MSIFKITINAGPPAKFSPNPQVIAANDSVFWFNADQTQAHSGTDPETIVGQQSSEAIATRCMATDS